MDNSIERFEKNSKSWFHIEQIVALVLCFGGGIMLLHLKVYVIAIILLALFAYFFRLYLKFPKVIEIDKDALLYGKKKISWHEVDSVEFTLAAGRDYRDTIIIIKIKNKPKCIIHTQLYTGSGQIKTTISEYCNNHGIKFITKARGM